MVEFLGEDAPREWGDHVRTLEERNIEGAALGVALLGPVTAIQRTSPNAGVV